MFLRSLRTVRSKYRYSMKAVQSLSLMTDYVVQDSLKSGFDSLIIPAFERSCQTMFEQVDTTFQKGMAEHTSAAQQQFASSHIALASNLQVSWPCST